VTALVHKVYEEGMSGPTLAGEQDDALKNWLFSIPKPPASTAIDLDAAARGQTLFEGDGGCTAATRGSTSRTTRRSTSGRAANSRCRRSSASRTARRFLHTGCAQTLTERFGTCGGSAHGNAGGFSASQIADLVAYLSTL